MKAIGLYVIRIGERKMEIKTVAELIDYLNKVCKENEAGCLKWLLDQNAEVYETLKQFGFKYITSVDTDEHRWFVLSENVYEATINGVKYYLGAWEVEMLKSECMTIKDCGCVIEFYEMEQYTTISYRAK